MNAIEKFIDEVMARFSPEPVTAKPSRKRVKEPVPTDEDDLTPDDPEEPKP